MQSRRAADASASRAGSTSGPSTAARNRCRRSVAAASRSASVGDGNAACGSTRRTETMLGTPRTTAKLTRPTDAIGTTTPSATATPSPAPKPSSSAKSSGAVISTSDGAKYAQRPTAMCATVPSGTRTGASVGDSGPRGPVTAGELTLTRAPRTAKATATMATLHSAPPNRRGDVVASPPTAGWNGASRYDTSSSPSLSSASVMWQPAAFPYAPRRATRDAAAGDAIIAATTETETAATWTARRGASRASTLSRAAACSAASFAVVEVLRFDTSVCARWACVTVRDVTARSDALRMVVGERNAGAGVRLATFGFGARECVDVACRCVAVELKRAERLLEMPILGVGVDSAPNTDAQRRGQRWRRIFAAASCAETAVIAC
mmetsp:Transcript_28897/g.89456  ORF Transcript_28897/g.89456 Transcript_28897/m.89456 type:complete len:379 (+) Transcript_28897:627-1763(+)